MLPAGSGLIRLTLEPAVEGRVRAAAVRARITPGVQGAGLLAAIDDYAGEVRDRHGGTAPAAIAGLAPARELYRDFGIDPTRRRPSSEALLRRALRGQPFPRISAPVDLANLIAVRFLLPIGLYDADRVEGAVTLRAGAPGESYRGVRKDSVGLEGRPVLADARGAFGNPTADSMRTAVDATTSALWLVIWAPGSYPGDELQARVRDAGEQLRRYLGATGCETAVT